jgi:hypothetical protein
MSLLDTLLAKGAKPMERVGCLSKKEFLERFGLCNKPCVIERLSESWPALAKWSWKQLGEMNEEALVTDDGDRFESVRVGDFVSKIRDKSAGKLYMKDATFHHGAMSQDFATPDMFENWLCEKELTNKHPRLCDPHYPRWSWMYVGPKNSSSPLHVDVFHSSAFNCVMRGRKMWMFFPPEVLEKDLVKPDGSYWDPFDPVSPIPFEKALVTLQNEVRTKKRKGNRETKFLTLLFCEGRHCVHSVEMVPRRSQRGRLDRTDGKFCER